ncbi:SanA/YdcF family protein [Vibrio tritonius]|uniref:SanA/YdcF family protein n=1 Tax=Vibrio tritonius TaxID=1435069 RepID=UPI0008383242|nr:ElyC/SanA/YdcF family protein [Vibrio tritonius]
MGTKKSSNLSRQSTQLSRFSRFKRALRRCVLLSGVAVIAGGACLIGVDRWIAWQTQNNIMTDIDDVSHYQVAVVLGTSKYLGKTLNDYYMNRINAAIKLFHEGKVSNFLLSGDNAHRSYNEPWTMKRDLLKAGIPESAIHLDYAGFRTLDSIVRAKRIFDTSHFLIITQGFHCERALYIAHYHDIQASCLAVAGPTHFSGMSVRVREVFARAKAFVDLYLLNTQPKFLGPKQPITPLNEDNKEPSLEASEPEMTNANP